VWLQSILVSSLTLDRKLLFSLFTCVMAVTITEAALRLAGLPEGTFQVVAPGQAGLWPAGFSAEVTLGPIPYHVVANTDGFRGPPLRTDGAPRVACIGDSMTDGFYVDNPHTYPAALQRSLTARGADVEVVNAARGGGSIDRFAAILEQTVLPRLDPDLVVVTWVNNDPWELGRSAFMPEEPQATDSIVRFLLRNTALGEGLQRLALHRHTHYRPATGSGDARYEIDGWDQHAANSALFFERFEGARRLLALEPDPEVRSLFRSYGEALRVFLSRAAEAGVPVLYLIIPSYPEVYGAPRPHLEAIRPILAETGTPHVDLLPVLQAAEEPVFLAPVDFHLTPEGNRVMAEAITPDVLEALSLP